ncbi:MAG TPA: hypothetical protein VFM58_25345 [Solirubrobacteraceae bacterium]|nr:hypothetical protein [Solirubrobacteraceae bacterium]
MAKLIATAVLAVLIAGCGSNKQTEQTAAPAPAPTATVWEGDLDVEEEYDQPPQPASGRIGDTITLTGSNVGVRMRVTVTGLVDRTGPAGRYLAVKLRMRSTGIAVYESELRNALVRYADGRRARAAFGVKTSCSHGFQRHLRVEVGASVTGCVAFRRPAGGATPRTLRLALETEPVRDGGLWRLG